MTKTGKGLPRSLQNVDFSDLDISVGWEEVTGKPAVIASGGKPRGGAYCYWRGYVKPCYRNNFDYRDGGR